MTRHMEELLIMTQHKVERLEAELAASTATIEALHTYHGATEDVLTGAMRSKGYVVTRDGATFTVRHGQTELFRGYEADIFGWATTPVWATAAVEELSCETGHPLHITNGRVFAALGGHRRTDVDLGSYEDMDAVRDELADAVAEQDPETRPCPLGCGYGCVHCGGAGEVPV